MTLTTYTFSPALSGMSNNFTVPTYTTMNCEVWGDGADGGAVNNTINAANGANGGSTTISGTGINLIANGGIGGHGSFFNNNDAPGGAGAPVGSGGDTNTAGNPGFTWVSADSIAPGGANGVSGTIAGGLGGNATGSSTANPGAAPGGAGSGRHLLHSCTDFGSGSGGSGGYGIKRFASGAITPGTVFTITFGATSQNTSYAIITVNDTPSGGNQGNLILNEVFD